ncbi:MAG: branched-chain amino acid ABC transporter permease [Stellaceae bacterium]
MSRRRTWGWSEEHIAAVVFVLLAVVPLVTGGYLVYVLPQYMLYGVLAMSLVLIWGFAGILSFGQAAFFAVGAYTIGLALSHGGPMDPTYAGLLGAVVVGGALAAACGYFLFSAGVRDMYFVLVTLALSIMTEQIANSQSQITGGFNGMFVKRISLALPGGRLLPLNGDAAMYFFVLAVVVIVYFVLRRLRLGRFGKILIGIRENEDRAISLGYRTYLYKTAAFALSGALAALAGALYASDAGFVSPSLGSVEFSTEVVVWVALGGRGSLIGGLLGAMVVAAASNLLSAIIPDYWELAVGIVFILVILFFKGGVAGALAQLARRREEA